MSDIPPIQPTPEGDAPPPNFAAYPRGPQVPAYGTPDKLQALSDGYFGMNTVFIVNVIAAFSARGVQLVAANEDNILVVVFGSLLVLGVLIGLVSYKYTSRLAVGKGWGSGTAVLMSVLLGMQAWLCCGAIGIVVLQQIATSEMKHYGLSASLFGLKKQVVEARIAEMRSSQQSSFTTQ